MINKLGNIRKIKERETPNDVFNTPLQVAVKLIDMTEIKETDRVLDPSKGDGVLFDNFPPCLKQWCEIREGRDFFEFVDSVDVIVSNPPFSIYTKWLQHCIKLNPRKIALVMGCLNLTTIRLKLLEDNGYYLTKLHIVNIRGWFGITYLVLFEKGGTPILSYDTVRH